jgi:hypothetical protein
MRSTIAPVNSTLITVSVVPHNEQAKKGVADNGAARLQPQGVSKPRI